MSRNSLTSESGKVSGNLITNSKINNTIYNIREQLAKKKCQEVISHDASVEEALGENRRQETP